MALVAVAFAQAPGRVVTDTKLDLTVDPVGFLGRALTLWDPWGAFGQVQNQAYGYLFPMGPFFALGQVGEIAPWVTQRLWWALLLVTAFLGVVKLLGAMQIGVPWARVLAGLVFALSPRMLSVMGASSIEMWPSALAPWVLVPLVIGVRRGDPRRQAALSALAVAMVGGVNAVATFAVVPLAAWWIWCMPRGPRRRALMTWWPPLVLLGTMWWILPLVLLGRYSPPFLQYIESASNTTVAATVLDALRGTTNWVPYVDVNADAGRLLITEPVLLLNTGVLVVLGIIGLSRVDLPWRRFLLSGLMLGLFLVTLGHVGATSGFGAATFRDLLDGALAPLRNTHKFDVLVRLPLVIALCHAVSKLTSGRTVGDDGRRRPDLLAIGVGVLACAAVLGATVPAWTAHIAPRGTYAEVPDYWEETADWLGDNAVGTTLLAPATTFGTYVWGRTNDEPMQPLASSPWAVRNVIPLVPGGNIEMLDTVSQVFATGQGSSGFASFLKRAGIGTVVVRNDIARGNDVLSPELVRATLVSTPGMRRVSSFGPTVGGGPLLPKEGAEPVFVDEGWQARRPAVEVFAFSHLADRHVTRSADVDVLMGGSGSLLRLDELGVTAGRSTVMGKDADPRKATGGTILTDGNRRQEAAFARVERNRSASLTPEEPYRADRRVHRYDEDEQQRWTATPELRGARSLTASSSQSDIGARPEPDASSQPWAAFDGDLDTAWRPDMSEAGQRSSLTLRLNGRVDVGTASISMDMPTDETRQLTVTTDRGKQTVTVRGRAPVEVLIGRTGRIELSGRSTPARPIAITQVDLPGVELSRPLVLPTLPAAWSSPSTILLQGADGRASGCLFIGGGQRCSDSHAAQVEDDRVLDRELTMPSAMSYDAQLRVAPRGGAALDALIQQGRLATVETSSQQTASPAAGAIAAADGDPLTGWVAAPDDADPTLIARWVKPRTVDSLQLVTSSSLAATAPASVRVRFSDGSEQTAAVREGRVEFEPVRSTFVEVHLDSGSPRVSVGFDGSLKGLPVGVSELRVDGIAGLPVVLDSTVRTWPCGSGPTVRAGGSDHRTRLVASPLALHRGSTVDAQWCGGEPSIDLGAGRQRIVVSGTAAVRPVDLLLTTDNSRSAAAGSGGVVVSTGHNANEGWTGREPGADVEPVVLDGWMQGYRTTSEDASALTESFAPGSIYRTTLFVGALMWLVLLLVCLLPALDSRRWPASRVMPTGSGPLLAPAAILTAGLLGGVPGIVAGILGVAAVTALRRVPWQAQAVGPLLVTAAMMFAVARPWAGIDTWSGAMATPQLLAVAGLSAAAAVGARLPTFFRRMKGSSTTR
ncbi:alpha-(1-_3)-arabinofuranosyltransferase domain-containing protein [Aeromicrobium wangtongii]|uniref:alpha-(1->3)-arabinofuranosyltransferase domain-containing protein n=1 Tax=Aeromicrobium wangtongii TaxID=2969247 RepID=UPI002017A36A|nr:DUF3367 domain-containing protein [Aeromicrobium wangtongii]MCL3818530.1 DUF3367 domain-containing protein [Aeromicrobium wangtongii]